jgi:hypothetical protein
LNPGLCAEQVGESGQRLGRQPCHFMDDHC